MQVTGYKFGLVYVGDGETKEEVFLASAHESADPAYHNFLEVCFHECRFRIYIPYSLSLSGCVCAGSQC
jgi:hypothetical protein